MKLKNFYIALNSDDFKQGPGGIVSDFNFQTYYFSNYIQRIIKNKFEVDGFTFIDIRGRFHPKENFEIDKTFKTFEIEIPFDLKRYQKIYPYKNDYPLEGRLLIPIDNQDDFSLFVFNMLIEGLEKSKSLNAPIPVNDLITIVNEFKEIGYKNEWIFKKKTFKEYNLKAELHCQLTSNFFSLKLKIWKGNNVIFNQEILRTLPDSIMYGYEFNDIIIENNILKITKKFSGDLFKIPLSELN